MKPIQLFNILIFFLGFSFAQSASAQSKTEKVVIKTSAVCDMCKKQIERAVSYEKGVKAVNLNIETRELTVEYATGKGDPEKFRKAVSKTGYDADHIPADPKAYEKIDECCKAENNMH